ncbi:MAG: hypothetical protein HN731_15920 [Rhodospirillaceae bacterium]|nr:hypothetical protein [Rhodospirillaceae bacterium]
MRIEHCSGTRGRFGGEFTGQAKIHTRRLAVFDTAWPFAVSLAAHAEVAQIGQERQAVDLHFAIGQFVFVLGDFDAVEADRIVVLLLAGDFTSVAAGAEIRIDHDAVFSHI